MLKIIFLLVCLSFIVWLIDKCFEGSKNTAQQNTTVSSENENFETELDYIKSHPQETTNNMSFDGYDVSHNYASYDPLNMNDDNLYSDKEDSGLIHNMCSKACCSAQYPLPFKLKIDPMLAESKEEYYPSNYTCNNGWQDAGCVCMTVQQRESLDNRGGNR